MAAAQRRVTHCTSLTAGRGSQRCREGTRPDSSSSARQQQARSQDSGSGGGMISARRVSRRVQRAAAPRSTRITAGRPQHAPGRRQAPSPQRRASRARQPCTPAASHLVAQVVDGHDAARGGVHAMRPVLAGQVHGHQRRVPVVGDKDDVLAIQALLAQRQLQRRLQARERQQHEAELGARGGAAGRAAQEGRTAGASAGVHECRVERCCCCCQHLLSKPSSIAPAAHRAASTQHCLGSGRAHSHLVVAVHAVFVSIQPTGAREAGGQAAQAGQAGGGSV